MRRFPGVAAFILAGGASKRMGRDKALLEFGGVPLLVRAAQLVTPQVTSVAVVAPEGRYTGLGLRLLADRWPGTGPLGGIATALCASAENWNLILSCDLPYLTEEWIGWLIARALDSPAQAVVPESRRGLEPLAAMYHSGCGELLARAVERGVRRVRDALNEILFERVPSLEWMSLDPAGTLLENMNTPEDYEEATRRLRGEAAG